MVDDQSTDATAAIAGTAGATVIDGRGLPDGWAGKAWALQQGIEAASVAVGGHPRRGHPPGSAPADGTRSPSDRRPVRSVHRRRPVRLSDTGKSLAAPRHADHARLPVRSARYSPQRRPDRTMANGQCMAFERSRFLEAGGMAVGSRRGRRGRRPRPAARIGRLAGRVPRRRRAAHRSDVRVVRGRVDRLGPIARAPGGRIAQPSTRRPRGRRAHAGPADPETVAATRRRRRPCTRGAPVGHPRRHHVARTPASTPPTGSARSPTRWPRSPSAGASPGGAARPGAAEATPESRRLPRRGDRSTRPWRIADR